MTVVQKMWIRVKPSVKFQFSFWLVRKIIDSYRLQLDSQQKIYSSQDRLVFNLSQAIQLL